MTNILRILKMSRFRGKLGAAIALITSLIVGFLTIPNNILYFIDNSHGTRNRGSLYSTREPRQERSEQEYAYIHAGIALVILGCLAMVVSIVLSYFAIKSKRKVEESQSSYRSYADSKSTNMVFACLVMMNIELFMSVIAGCMELLYRPLMKDYERLHKMEFAIAIFNIIVYIMYVVSMMLTSTVLKGNHEQMSVDVQSEMTDDMATPLTSCSSREYMSRNNNPYYSQSSVF